MDQRIAEIAARARADGTSRTDPTVTVRHDAAIKRPRTGTCAACSADFPAAKVGRIPKLCPACKPPAKARLSPHIRTRTVSPPDPITASDHNVVGRYLAVLAKLDPSARLPRLLALAEKHPEPDVLDAIEAAL